jgi:hypothetical protein
MLWISQKRKKNLFRLLIARDFSFESTTCLLGGKQLGGTSPRTPVIIASHAVCLAKVFAAPSGGPPRVANLSKPQLFVKKSAQFLFFFFFPFSRAGAGAVNWTPPDSQLVALSREQLSHANSIQFCVYVYVYVVTLIAGAIWHSRFAKKLLVMNRAMMSRDMLLSPFAPKEEVRGQRRELLTKNLRISNFYMYVRFFFFFFQRCARIAETDHCNTGKFLRWHKEGGNNKSFWGIASNYARN